MTKSRRFRFSAALLAAVALVGTACGSAAPSSAPASHASAGAAGGSSAGLAAAKAFYKGKTLTVIIPYGAAGGYEWWAAGLKPYLQKDLGVARIDLVNKTGGGGLVGADTLYAARPDGLTVGEVNGTGSIFAQVIKKPGVSFSMAKYDWIGAPDNETVVTVLRSGDKYKSFADLWKLRGGSTKVIGLSAGYGGNDYVSIALPLATFGIPYKMLVAYQGSSATKAGLVRGDGDLASYGYSALRALIKSNKVVPLYVDSTTSFSKLPNVSTVLQVAKQHHLSAAKIATLNAMIGAVAMGKDWAAPPGTPANRLAFLRQAFKQAVNTPAFVAMATKAHRIAGYSSPQHIGKVIGEVVREQSKFTPFLKP